MTEYCDRSGSTVPPIPVPPVRKVPMRLRDPSVARGGATTALPPVAFVSVYTAPGRAVPRSSSGPCGAERLSDASPAESFDAGEVESEQAASAIVATASADDAAPRHEPSFERMGMTDP